MALAKAFFRRKTAIILSAVVAVLLFLGAKKVFEFGATPARDKECDYIYPESTDQTKPTTLTLRADQVPLTLEQIGGTINDASCLNKTSVYGIVKVASADDVRKALAFARDNHLKVTSAGQRHSMGGQSFSKGGLVLDMRALNHMTLDKQHRILTVETGAKWAAVQELLDKEGLSVKAMQSINIFTVGGTLSVNAHGVAHDPGQIAPTVRSMHIMTVDGRLLRASPTENADLFRHALGGYGLFGVIIDVNLDVVPNEVYAWHTQHMDYKEFPAFYKKNIDGNDKLGLMYARISLSPVSYMTETAVNMFEKTPWEGEIPPLKVASLDWFSRLVINFSKTGGLGRWTRWMLEKYVEHRIHTCVSRNTAMTDDYVCDVSRNQEMYDAMGYLKNRLPDTDILQEYFIPPENMPAFVDGLRDTVKRNGANLLNITIRIVHKDTVTALPYAKSDRFAFVLYFNQKFNDKESMILRKTTTDLIDLATGMGGAYYLPYQLYYSPEQLRKAYPEADAFFAAKRQYDPGELLVNTWYEKYGKP